MSEEGLYASPLQKGSEELCYTISFPLEGSYLSRGVARSPGAHVLVQGEVVFAIITVIMVPSEEPPVWPNFAAKKTLEGMRTWSRP